MWQYYYITRIFTQQRLREAAADRLAAQAKRTRKAYSPDALIDRITGLARGRERY